MVQVDATEERLQPNRAETGLIDIHGSILKVGLPARADTPEEATVIEILKAIRDTLVRIPGGEQEKEEGMKVCVTTGFEIEILKASKGE